MINNVSGIILAGGKSSRIGQDKATILLQGKTFLDWQIQKMQALGIKDILISSPEAVKDIYPERGPLGGLHAGLQAAKNPRCLVLGVDIPLVPVSVLVQLCHSHIEGVTVLEHDGWQEPLIGMYDSNLYKIIEPIIQTQSASVRVLGNYVPWNVFTYQGPEEMLRNCNTEEDYDAICRTISRYAKKHYECEHNVTKNY